MINSDQPAVAAIDCGTNTIRLLIMGADGAERHRDQEIVRLGQGVDATGELHPDALVRTFRAVEQFAPVIVDHDCSAVRFVATSAARDAGNADEFFAGIRERLGVEAEVITGAEEASLSYLGAVHGLPAEMITEPVLVMDIGGGSTELVLGQGTAIDQSVSLDIGSVRLTERFTRHDPPTDDELAQAAGYIDALLDDCGVELQRAATWVGVAGTATSLAAIQLGLTSYDRTLVHASTLPRERVIELSRELAARTAAERVEQYHLPPGRADVIACGSLIAARIATRVRADLLISETDILDGIALGLLRSLQG